ncbi:hypothetical protein [uncultured Winogradskyella sp.]|uniref:hypothetical protein n=1 Tax=uncultured Winogradskyella sp. TaxID=395353 RepID=UPI0030D7D43D|tara:strand:- start:5910 stop:6425 length:516 start_codon:yes stop_codon:yes gene_type:complete
MKNFGLLLLGIILGALAMYYYCFNNKVKMTSEPITSVTPKGLITPKEAKVLDAAYSFRHKIISDSLFSNTTTGDNRSSWWSLEDIQNYIKHAENQAGELGYIMDGLRVYLGAYPDAKGETGLTTMFFIPTGYNNTSEGSMMPLRGGSGDISGGDGLNMGESGKPPGANYPQ